MLTHVHPKLPMRHKATTRAFYLRLGFQEFGQTDFDAYLMVQKDAVQLHFFEHKHLDPTQNYGQVYIRTDNIDALYQTLLHQQTSIHPNGSLERKPWMQKEFSILDPDNNLLTFGQSI